MLIFGYSLSSINVIPDLQERPLDPNYYESGPKRVVAEFEQLNRVRNKLNNLYHHEFIQTLSQQALDKTDRYTEVTHESPQVGDLVLIKEQFSKPHQYPLGKITKIYKNDLNEVTHLEIRKGVSGEITKRHASTVIPLLHINQSVEPVPIHVLQNAFYHQRCTDSLPTTMMSLPPTAITL